LFNSTLFSHSSATPRLAYPKGLAIVDFLHPEFDAGSTGSAVPPQSSILACLTIPETKVDISSAEIPAFILRPKMVSPCLWEIACGRTCLVASPVLSTTLL